MAYSCGSYLSATYDSDSSAPDSPCHGAMSSSYTGDTTDIESVSATSSSSSGGPTDIATHPSQSLVRPLIQFPSRCVGKSRKRAFNGSLYTQFSWIDNNYLRGFLFKA